MKHFFRHNGIWVLIIAGILAVVTFAVSSALGGTASPLRNLVGVLSTPLRSIGSSFAAWTEERYNDAYERERLLDEIERLQGELSDMQDKAREGEQDSNENERLRSLLGLRAKEREFTLESATVTEHSRSNWSSTLTISKGAGMGVAVNDCVVDAYYNLVGVVTEVGENWAIVSTLIDANLQMGATITRTAEAVILEGDFSLMGEGKSKLSYLPDGDDVLPGDEVLTSGKGGLYPSGLVVGTIEAFRTEASGMTRYAVVLPAAQLDQLQQVFVIVDFTIVE